MQFQLIAWSRYLYLAGIVLALVLVIPTTWFPFQLLKLGAFALLVCAAAVLFILGRGTPDLLRSHGFYAALGVALLPLSYVLSYLFSTDKSVGFSGYAVEADTLVFVSLAFVSFLLSFGLFRTQRTVRMLLSTLFVTLAAAALFQVVSVLFGSVAIPLATFADRSVNLVGKWNDLALVIGVLTLILLARVELMESSRFWKIGAAVAGAGLVLLLAIINFALGWGMILGFSIAMALISFITQRTHAKETGESLLRSAPWFSIALALISIVFLFWGSAINAKLTSVFPVSSLEVRPSYESTFGIINAARGGEFSRVFVGTGPNTFGRDWLLQKPTDVNLTPFWNLDFNVGFSTLTTALGTVGIVGVLAWLLPLFLVIAGIVRAMRSTVLSREDRTLATTLALCSLFIFAGLIFYVPSPNIILLGMILSGAAFGFLWRQGQPAREETPVNSFVSLGAMIVLLVLVVLSTFIIERRFIAQAYVGWGISRLSAGSVEDATRAGRSALAIENNFDAHRLLIDAGSTKLQAIATNTSLPVAQAQQQFASTTDEVIVAAQNAIKLFPQDYRPHLGLANVYAYLASFNIQGAADVARATYQKTMELNPKNPQIPLLLSRLEFGTNNPQLGQKYLADSLTLKSNYTDAILFLVQLHIANNDLRNAIIAAQAAAQSAPGVGPIWFQLGLLYYAGGFMQDAIPAFEQAIRIIPDYANAKYFLGVAYYTQKRTPEGLALFEDLARSNPGNTEVKTILENMRAGKAALDGVTPPAPAPERRDTAPISE